MTAEKAADCRNKGRCSALKPQRRDAKQSFAFEGGLTPARQPGPFGRVSVCSATICALPRRIFRDFL
jgi:hypothetical protein